ncbi:alpha-ribazole phosphatase [Dyadobacter frigoris]|uniref:Alpha-ribazole phosphatase n=1 Tax=Dyadobacter frigoris TaxID=2576211 RepID=A0A4U6DCE7_9BACT|nr:alpha-ribazole phosphatase [Dyadobacter frigoris]TKT94171.1 alpha-ribazole phosphatase [Dyadobacter frigoris]GLU50641.1 alpha-ribazole phosphatase [Dyadobacter frigoris]
MEIYLVRHTTPSLSPGLIYGRLDVALEDTFQAEFEIIKTKLPGNPDVIYSSPSTRCTLLAQKINPVVTTDSRLLELNFGDWEGATWDTVNESDLKIWMDDFVNIAVPGGESMQQMSARVLSFWSQLIQSGYEKAIIVTHGGVIRLILAHLRTIELVNTFDIKVAYGEVVTINIPEIVNIN